MRGRDAACPAEQDENRGEGEHRAAFQAKKQDGRARLIGRLVPALQEGRELRVVIVIQQMQGSRPGRSRYLRKTAPWLATSWRGVQRQLATAARRAPQPVTHRNESHAGLNAQRPEQNGDGDINGKRSRPRTRREQPPEQAEQRRGDQRGLAGGELREDAQADRADEECVTLQVGPEAWSEADQVEQHDAYAAQQGVGEIRVAAGDGKQRPSEDKPPPASRRASCRSVLAAAFGA